MVWPIIGWNVTWAKRCKSTKPGAFRAASSEHTSLRRPCIIKVGAGSALVSEGDFLNSPMPPRPGQQPPGPQPLPGVDTIIAVGSGKGGVGKTTLAVNLAIALSKLGSKVGLLDADVYGPNVPLMLGVKGQPQANPEGKIDPLRAHD